MMPWNTWRRLSGGFAGEHLSRLRGVVGSLEKGGLAILSGDVSARRRVRSVLP